MNKQVLVAYASKYGATAEIAKRIGLALQTTGFTVDVQSIDKVVDPANYSGIILGSAVYAGNASVGDFRDWDMIHSWAMTIAATLQAEVGEPVWS